MIVKESILFISWKGGEQYGIETKVLYVSGVSRCSGMQLSANC